jgi:hypothetical protein
MGSLRRALSPTFPAGEMVFFIPWRVVAEESGAAHFGFGGAMLLDLLGPALRLLTDVADFHFRAPRKIAALGEFMRIWTDDDKIRRGGADEAARVFRCGQAACGDFCEGRSAGDD